MSEQQPFMQSGDRILPVAQMQERAMRAARGLIEEIGVEEGGSVAIMLRNDFPYLEAMAASTRIGAYPVSVNWHLAPDEAAYVLNDCGANVAVIHADIYRRISHAMPKHIKPLIVPTPPEIAGGYGLSRQDCSLPDGLIDWTEWLQGFAPWEGPEVAARGSMIYTSGTTGKPKGVRREPVSPENMERFMMQALRGFSLDFAPRAVMTGPMYHSATNAYASASIGLGGSLVLMSRFDPEELLRLIQEHQLTHMHLVPTLFVRLLRLPEATKKRYDLSSLKSITHGAAPCPPEVKRAMIEWWGPVINEYYGSTEAGIVSVASSEDSLTKPGTVGPLLEGVEVRIYNDNDELCGPGETGEMYARRLGAPDFTYQNRDDARREIDRDGFVTNGDIGMMDEDGYLFIMDRKRDMIISGGVNIYPAEIEAVLMQHEQIADAAVFGIPDEEFGEAICAYIQPVTASALDEADLRPWLEERCGRFKTPREIRFSDELPREETGKIFKRKLREPFWAKADRKI